MNLALLQILNTLGSIFLIGRHMERADDLRAAADSQDQLADSINDFQAQVGDWESCRRDIEDIHTVAESLKEEIIDFKEDLVDPACEILSETRDLKVGVATTASQTHTLNRSAVNKLVAFLGDHDKNC